VLEEGVLFGVEEIQALLDERGYPVGVAAVMGEGEL